MDYRINTTYRGVASPSASQSGRVIRFGDRIYVRLTSGGRTLCSFGVDKVATLTDLIAEVRRAARGHRGLTMMHIRNASRGWSMERPLMLYPPQEGYGRTSPQTYPVQGRTSGRMPFPWETH